MPNRVNQLLVESYKERFQDAENLVAVGYEGLDIENTNDLRARLAAQDIRMLFIKNRLVEIAFRELGRPSVKDICQGQTAFATSEDPVALARFLMEYKKEHDQLRIHGALVEGTLLDTDQVTDLSKSPTKEELKGQISGQALAPGANVSGALIGIGRTLAGQIKQISENEEEAGGAEAA